MKRLSLILRLWVMVVFVSIVVCGLVYAAVQQTLRQDANDPQIQLAEGAAAALASGQSPASVAGGTVVNMRTSLAPFLIVLDNNRHVLASSGHLDGHTVLPPAQAFSDAAANNGKDATMAQESRITWQPDANVREATVIVHYQGGYVLAARSLREVEIREDKLTLMCATAFGVLVFGGLLGLVLLV